MAASGARMGALSRISYLYECAAVDCVEWSGVTVDPESGRPGMEQ